MSLYTVQMAELNIVAAIFEHLILDVANNDE